MVLREGLNINCFSSQFIISNSVPDMAIQIMITAQEKLRIKISPLDTLCSHICPNPQNKSDSIAAVMCRYDLLFVIYEEEPE